MKYLFVFIKIIFNKSFIVFLGILLTILASFSSISLLAISSWFLTASYLVASTNLNFFYPSSAVRGLAIGRTFFKYIQRLTTHDSTLSIIVKLQIHIFAGLLPLKNISIKNINNTEILNKIISDVKNIENLYIQILVPFISNIFIFLLMTFLLSFIDLKLSIIIGSTLIIAQILIPWLFYFISKRISHNSYTINKENKENFINYLKYHLDWIFFLQKDKINNILIKDEEFRNIQNKQTNILNIANFTIQFIIAILITITLYYSSNLSILSSNTAEINSLAVIFIYVIIGSLDLILPIASAFLHLEQIISASKNIGKIVDDPIISKVSTNLFKFYDNKEEIKRFNKIFPEKIDDSIIDNISYINISIKDLSLNYNNINILNKVNLNINHNDMLLLIGETGVGKSSLINCILGFENTYNGSISIKAYDSKNILLIDIDANSGMQNQLISYLPQRIHIFNDSIRNNILISNNKASDEMIANVLNKVELSYLINEYDKLDTILGIGGRPLSGGEIRKIGIARILISNNKFIILDEPTESLDEYSETITLKLIQKFAINKGVITISHNEKYDYIFNKKYIIRDKSLRKLT